MDSQIERISPVECRVNVEIAWDEVSGRLDRKMREVRSKLRLPGFRPGKVPPPVVERMYGRSVRDELARDLVNETFQNAVVQHDTVPLTEPVVEKASLEKGQPFTYAARFEVPPQLEPTGYEGIEVRRRPTVVEDEKVVEVLEKRREELAELHPPADDRKETKAGDVWTLDVDGTLGEQSVARKDVSVEIGKEEGEFIPGLGAQLESITLDKVGSVVEINYTPPQERLRPELRGEEAKLKLGLREVREKRIPALDDEFARDTGDAETLEELRTKVREQLEEEDGLVAEREARQRLVEAILAKNEFDPAPSMISREVAAQVDMTKRQLANQGMTLAHLGTSEGEMANRIRPQAAFNVKAFLLLDAIGKKQSIDVSDDELNTELEKLAEERGQNLARMRATMEKNQELLLLRAQMREEKILDFLMEKAKVTEAPDPEVGEQSVDDLADKAKSASDGSSAASTGSRRKKRKSKSSEDGDAEAAESGDESGD